MTSTDDVLAQIDSAMEDWTISGDAMRSRPGGGTKRPGFQGATPTVHIVDEAGEWQQLDGIARIDFHIEQPVIDPEIVRAWQEMQERIVRAQMERARQIAAMFDALRQAFRQAMPAVQQAAEAFQHLPEAEGCDDCGKPPRPRDRPAWQSLYGPARRRRR
ncbi:hypothetical protein [Streptomyces sp. NPDC088736]|uniref:hypothetical protein n=1 Tax=Streptomyces sp. NPDC088736 TaxID=3365881 RepID=UPI00381E99FC